MNLYALLSPHYDRAMGGKQFLRTRRAFGWILRRYGISFGSAADVGGGSGLFARWLKVAWGVPVFGVDRSPEMMAVAAKNCRGSGVRLLLQDIRHLKLPHPVDLVTANFDTMNHMATREDFCRTIRKIRENLRPGGHFLFDLVTPAYGGKTSRKMIRLQKGKCLLLQWISWNSRSRIFKARVQRRCGEGSITSDAHEERAYDPREVARMLVKAGFMIRAVLDSRTLDMATTTSPRVIFLATIGPAVK